jgi:glycerol-3-phosphate dehydrogenase
MLRDLEDMSRTSFDLLVVGGGITGVCVAWDAALRGLRVALVEKDDFGGATSAATSKLIHGGLRYLREREFRLVRESLHERRVLELIAPHLVYPIPFLIPTFKGRQGKVPLTLGMIVYELLAYDRAQVDDQSKRIPSHKNLSPQRVREMEPGIPSDGLTGGILFYDCQMYSPERLTLEFMLSAAARGARHANYAKVTGFLADGGRITGAEVEDRLTEKRFNFRARLVANVTGPWADLLLETLSGEASKAGRMVRSKGIHLITRPIVHNSAVVLITDEGRHVFLVPWRERTLIGTTDTPYDGHPDELTVSEEEILAFIHEVNEALPTAHLERRDVLAFYAGLRPLVGKDTQVETYHASRKYEIFDHREEGTEGLLTVVGGKYTTARSLAKKLVDQVFQALGHEPPECKTENTPLYGGNVGRFDDFLQRVLDEEGDVFSPVVLENLVRSYGSRYEDVLYLARRDPVLSEPLHPDLPEIGAQVVHAVRNEMARSLGDVVFRRTSLCTLMHPGQACLERVCELMARELGWGRAQRRREIQRVDMAFQTADG